MKKILTVAAAIIMLTTSSVCAASTNYVMNYEKMPEGLEWGDIYKLAAVDKATGKVIPISDCTSDYGYAYVPEGTEISFEQREEIKFNDIPEYGEPAGLDDLSRRSVFSGDENGNFNENEILTRADDGAFGENNRRGR